MAESLVGVGIAGYAWLWWVLLIQHGARCRQFQRKRTDPGDCVISIRKGHAAMGAMGNDVEVFWALWVARI